MKALLFILFLPAFGYAVRPHEYHLAFLELEYNSKATRFEATLKVTAHDLAYITSKKHQKDYSIDQILKDSLLRREIEIILLSGFTLWNGTQEVYFTLEAFETNHQGELLVFLSSEPTPTVESLSLSFPLLTTYFPDQQNKVTYLSNGKQCAVTFLLNDLRKEIPKLL